MSSIKGANFVTAAKLACELRTPYARIIKTIQALGLTPSFTLNGIGHYDDDAQERIAAEVHSAPKSAQREAMRN